MIDFFALALSHGLLALACWRILRRGDLDAEIATNQASAPADRSPVKAKPGLRTHA